MGKNKIIHLKYLHNDTTGELSFFINKIRNTIFCFITSTACKLKLKLGGGNMGNILNSEVWQ